MIVSGRSVSVLVVVLGVSVCTSGCVRFFQRPAPDKDDATIIVKNPQDFGVDCDKCPDGWLQPEGGVDGRASDLNNPDLSPSDLLPPDLLQDDIIAQPPAGQIALGIQGRKNSYVYQLALRTNGDVKRVGIASRLDGLGTGLRCLTIDNGQWVIGHGFNSALRFIDPRTLQGEVAAVSQLNNVHGICRAQNGDFVLGEYGMGSGNRVALYTVSQTPLSVSRKTSVFNTTVSAGTLSHCVATSSTIYLTDYNASADRDGDVVRLDLNGTWQQTARFDISTFGTAGHSSAIYTFVVHPDGHLYAFPMRRFGSRLKRLIRCPLSDISAANCQQLATLPADTSTSDYGPGTLMGSALEASGDILFSTGEGVYRYRLASDSVSKLYDLTAHTSDLQPASGGTDSITYVRTLVWSAAKY
jgi:hypothetical protein